MVGRFVRVPLVDSPARPRERQFVPVTHLGGSSTMSAPSPAVVASAVAVRWRIVESASVDIVETDVDPTVVPALSFVRVGIHAIATFVVITMCGLVVAASVPTLLGFSAVSVSTGSMTPAIRVGDIVVTAPTDGEGLGDGTVVNFRQDDDMRLHRITAVVDGGYRTAGDANRSPDSSVVAPEQITGVGVMLVPLVGMPRQWAADGQYLPLGVLVVFAIASLHLSRSAWVRPRRALVTVTP